MNATRQPSRRTIALAVGLAVLLTAGLFAGAGYVLLKGFNPVGDEYVCSEGEVPGGRAPVGPGEGNDCYQPDALPQGVEADPLGNRPMSYNCDKDGYRLLVKTEGRGAGKVTECISVDTEIPAGWEVGDLE